MTNFIKYLILTLFLPLIMLSIMNLLIDSHAYLNNRQIINFEKSLRENGAQSIYFNLAERKLLDIRLSNHEDYSHCNNFIIGSSKVLLVGKNTNRCIFNAGFSNFSYNDLIIVSNKLIDSKIYIDTIIINIDPVLFNIIQI
jgi:hypothetical protein